MLRNVNGRLSRMFERILMVSEVVSRLCRVLLIVWIVCRVLWMCFIVMVRNVKLNSDI